MNVNEGKMTVSIEIGFKRDEEEGRLQIFPHIYLTDYHRYIKNSAGGYSDEAINSENWPEEKEILEEIDKGYLLIDEVAIWLKEDELLLIEFDNQTIKVIPPRNKKVIIEH